MFAIMSVVLCHACELPGNEFGLPGVGLTPDTWVYAVGIALGRVGVPLFLMLSGALVLTKRFESASDVWNFYKRSLVPLVVTYEIWVVIYTVFNWVMGYEPVRLVPLVKDMLFMHSGPMVNTWYVPMIAGLYLAAPFVSIALRVVPPKLFLFVLAFIAFEQSVIPAAERFAGLFAPGVDWWFDLNLEFFGGLFGIYLMCGYFIHAKGLLERVPTSVLAAVSAVGLAGAVGFTILYASTGYEYRLFYDEPFLMVGSVALFELIRRGHVFASEKPFVRTVSLCSFGIFFVHILPVKVIAYPGSPVLDLPYIVAVLIVALVSFAISLLVVWAVSKSRPLAKVLFDMKA